MSSYSGQIGHLKQVIGVLQQNLTNLSTRTTIQRQLCTQYMHLFDKFSKNLSSLSGRIQQHANKLESKNGDSLADIFRCLSLSLSEISSNSKIIATKCKNQILDPLRLFTDNCMELNKQFVSKLKSKEIELNEKYSEFLKNKDYYIAAEEKLDKTLKAKSKLLNKVEYGNPQLEKLTNNVKKINETIKNAEESYSGSVKTVNKSIIDLRDSLKQISESISYNQESRIAFTKKTLLYSVKNLKPFCPLTNQELDSRLDASIQSTDNHTILNAYLSQKIGLIVKGQQKQEVVPYEQILKRKKKKNLEQSNNHLTEIFSKVKDQDKNAIKKMVRLWFKQDNTVEEVSQQQHQINNQKVGGWQKYKETIITVLPYSYFFIWVFYQQISETNFNYFKVDHDKFITLLELFSSIINHLKLKESGSMTVISLEFVYRIVKISMKVMWKKEKKVSPNQQMELICYHLKKKVKQLNHEDIYNKMFWYLQKLKTQKKVYSENETSKGMMDSFMKGFQEAMSFKKEAKLTQQQYIECLTELTSMMSCLLTPSQVGVSLIKKLLSKVQNTKIFDQLIRTLNQKKDQQERHRMFFKKEVKEKMEAEIKQVIQKGKIAQYCIKLTAKLGFFGKSEFCLQLVCSDLKHIKNQILYKLEMETKIKWIHLIPFDKEIKYRQILKEVKEKGINDHSEEIIVLDVNRSLQNHSQRLGQQTLKNLLRAYAYIHPDISYCQGMNYIAGYIYMKAEDEETAFRLFEYLMESRFRELFANQFQSMKGKLYQFDKLLNILQPQIGEHFKKQGISPECYLVAWIITVFASSYQYTDESYLIDLLWERFIIWGWPEFFKFVLAIFHIYREDLIELTYDKAMHFLGNIARCDIIKCNKKEYFAQFANQNLEKIMEHNQISQQFLEALYKQYESNN